MKGPEHGLASPKNPVPPRRGQMRPTYAAMLQRKTLARGAAAGLVALSILPLVVLGLPFRLMAVPSCAWFLFLAGSWAVGTAVELAFLVRALALCAGQQQRVAILCVLGFFSSHCTFTALAVTQFSGV